MSSQTLYEQLRRGEIRVFVIEKGTDSRITIEMKTIDLERQGGIRGWLVSFRDQYHALSYCWGNPKNLRPIVCNGQDMEIHSNLYDALVVLKQLRPGVAIWADAICINQKDKDEKMAQIKIMGKIYSKARQVWAFLGDAPPGMAELMVHLPELCRVCQKMESSSQSWVALQPGNWSKRTSGFHETPSLPSAGSRVWETLMSVMTSEYFNRLWILQEVSLARRVDFLCGSHSISWNQMRLLFTVGHQMQAFQRHIPTLFRFNQSAFNTKAMVARAGAGWVYWCFGISRTYIRLFSDYFADKYGLRLEDAGIYETLTNLWKNLASSTLDLLLQNSKWQVCSEPEDRILAITGMLQSLLDWEDYPWMNKTTAEDVYLEAFYFLAIDDQSFGMFRLAPSDIGSGLSLPSWCPNFNRQRDPAKLEDGFSGMVYPHWQASKLKQRICRGLDARRLSLNGVRLDEVGIVPERWQPLTLYDKTQPEDKLQANLAVNARWLESCQSLILSRYDAKGTTMPTEVTERFWRATVVEQVHLLGFEDLRLDDFLRAAAFLDRATSPASSYREEEQKVLARQKEPSAATEPSEMLILGIIDLRMKDKVFFTTPDGRFGLSFPGVRDGDTLVLLHGAKVPHLLRRVGNSDTWTFVSEAYVPGIMYGEAEQPVGGKAPVSVPFVLV